MGGKEEEEEEALAGNIHQDIAKKTPIPCMRVWEEKEMEER